MNDSKIKQAVQQSLSGISFADARKQQVLMQIEGGKPMQKKIPQRQCMGCRERKDKRSMLRVVRTTEGTVTLDFSGKLNGRGAYICPEPECLKKAQKANSLERALEVPIPQQVYDRLQKELEGYRLG